MDIALDVTREMILAGLFWGLALLGHVWGKEERRGWPLILLGAVVFESFVWSAIKSAGPAILYAGVLSVAVAFTLQVHAQRKARPAHTAILLSMESVFAAFGGWLLLGEGLSRRGLIGCALMLAGILMAQLGPQPTDGDV